jgi:MinD superfamily P-loop ATPase
MTELVVLSGKGGTGKTSITASLAVMAKNSIYADCDVDAANLHLLLNPHIHETYNFVGGIKAQIDQDKCIQCNACVNNCRFHAIKNYTVNQIACEGCAVCYYSCKNNAITIEDHESGEYYLSETKYGPMVHGRLGIAEGNSGKLVAKIKQKAYQLKTKDTELILIDGPPGIGCPVVSALTGADKALVVTEPTLSAIHDLERILQLIKQLKVEALVCINKANLHLENCKLIEEICTENNIKIVGKINYDKIFIESVVNNTPVVEYAHNTLINKQLEDLWINIKKN